MPKNNAKFNYDSSPNISKALLRHSYQGTFLGRPVRVKTLVEALHLANGIRKITCGNFSFYNDQLIKENFQVESS